MGCSPIMDGGMLCVCEDQEDFRNLLEEISEAGSGTNLSEESQGLMRTRFHQENLNEEHSICLALNHAFPNMQPSSSGMIITYKNDRANMFNSFALSKIINMNNPKIISHSIVLVSPDASYRGNQNLEHQQHLFN